MKKVLLFLFSLIISTNCFADEAMDFTKKFADEALKEIVATNLPLEKKKELFEKLFNKSVSMDLVANFALGRKIKTMSEDEKTSFSQLFEQNMILMWTLRFNEYQGQRIEFFDEKVSDNKKDVFVNSKIIDDKKVSDPAIDVVWRLRKTDDSYKIIDIIISNISMLKTYQSEYSAFLNQNGGEISALLNMLKEKNENYKKEMEKLKSKA